MIINEQTKVRDILDAYPWLPDTLVRLDRRFAIINNPIGKMMIRTATVADMAKKAGYPADQVLTELHKLIEKHEA